MANDETQHAKHHPVDIRKKTRWSAMGTVLSVSLLFGSVLIGIVCLDVFSKPSGPQIKLDSTCMMDLGKGELGTMLSGTFRIGNTGIAPLTFRLQPSCSCSQLSPLEGEIPQGGFQVIHVGIRLSQEGKTERVVVGIQSNDPVYPNTVYRVTGRCPAPLIVSPTHVLFGYVREGNLHQAMLKVYDSDGAPITATGKITTSSSNPHVSARVVMLDKDQCGLEVTLDKSCPRGSLSATIDVRLRETGRSIAIPVTADITGPVLVTPQTLFLARDDKGFYKQRVVLVSGLDDQPLEQCSILNKDKDLTIAERPSGSGTRKMFVVLAAPTFSARASLGICLDNINTVATVEVFPQVSK